MDEGYYVVAAHGAVSEFRENYYVHEVFDNAFMHFL